MGVVAVGRGVTFRHSLTSCDLKGTLSSDLVCLPGHNMKKNPKHVMSTMHKFPSLASGSSSKWVSNFVTTESGTGFTHCAGGHCFRQARKSCWSRGSNFPCGFNLGSLNPIRACACPTFCMASSTVSDCTGRRLGVMCPSRHRTANTCGHRTMSCPLGNQQSKECMA